MAPLPMKQPEPDSYWMLFEANPQPMWVVDLDTLRFLAVNEAALRHYGYERQEFLDLTLVDLRPPEDVPAFLEHMARVRARPPAPGDVETHERRHRRKDGHIIDVEIAWSPVRFGGRNAGLVMGTDVTERRLAEASLWESEARLRAVVSSAPIVVWAVDAARSFILSEGRGLAALGQRPGQVVGQSVSEVYRDMPRMQADVRRALGGESFMDTVDVGPLVFECWFAPLRNPAGEVVGATGVATDITERKSAEQALAASEERYRRFFEESPAACFISRPDGILLDCNSAFVRLFGYASVAAARGSDVRPLYTDRRVREALLERLEREGGIRDHEEELRRLDASPIYVRMNMVGGFEGGRLSEVQGYLVDITEQRRLENRLKARRELRQEDA